MSKTKPKKRIFGYWWSKNEPQYPKPVARKKAWVGRHDFIKGIEYLQARAKKRHFKGWSTCRICGCSNGSSEYVYKNASWPEGLLHYVRAHNVKPPQDFLDWEERQMRKLDEAHKAKYEEMQANTDEYRDPQNYCGGY